MKTTVKIFAWMFAALALIISIGGTWFIISNRNAQPVLLGQVQEAEATASELVQAISQGDYEKASSLMVGAPDMGVDQPASGQLGQLFWDSYQQSITFQAEGPCFATKDGIGQKYTVRYLDVTAVSQQLEVYCQELLAQRVENAVYVSEIYDSNNEYRQDVLAEVLNEAAQQALKDNAVYTQKTFTINMVYCDGKWLAVPDSALLQAITGGLAGGNK